MSSSGKHNPEYQYEVALFLVKALSNLHVGSNSENYGIIDNLVQRDPATGFPCINASSLKGAIREYCSFHLSINDVDWIFGKDKGGTEGRNAGDENFGQGRYRFLQADLLSIPVRGMTRPFYMATCPWLLENLRNQIGNFGMRTPTEWQSALMYDLGNKKGIHFGVDQVEIDLEDMQMFAQSAPQYFSDAKAVLGEEIVLLKDEHFVELVSDYHLPVIARNRLEDGQSANLWYEQVLPRETRLAFMVLYPKGESYERTKFEVFRSALCSEPVQIGANASVGYGFCSISEIQLIK